MAGGDYPGLAPLPARRLVLSGAVRGDVGGAELAPGRDVLGEAVRGLRLDAGVRQLDEWFQSADMLSAMERQMLSLLQLPPKLDQLLTVAADGTVRVQLATDEQAVARRSRAAATIALLLVAAAAVMLVGGGVSSSAAWSESARSVAMLLAGGLLVWAVGRVL